MAMGSCYTCIRYLMFAFNFLFWLLGCAILGVGIWVRVDENFGKYVNNSDHFDFLYTGAYLFIVAGILIMVVGFLGCCGAIRENQCMLGLFFALLFIIFVILLGSGIWAVVAKEQVKDIVNKALQDGVDHYFDQNSSSKEFMDIVQTDFQCCGATKGAEDYGIKFTMVPTCEGLIKPCNNELFNFVKENLVIIAGVSIGIAVILILGMIFSMILCCALRDSQV
ncbi:CD9 antigen-like isoform X2 [Mya arenaria]|nr:CD9 antigen-like isoform X2 [Mya arenaria]